MELIMARFKDQAVCIRLTEWSESSQVVTLLTQAHGKVRGLAKGSRRMSPSSIARYSGGFELLTAGQIVATTKPSSDLATLTEWDLQQPFDHLRRDLQAQQLGLYVADITHAMLADHDAHEKTYEGLMKALASLALPARRTEAVLAFQWVLLADTGYGLELGEDVITHASLDAPEANGRPAGHHLFHPHQGGFTTQGGHERANHPQGPWKVRRTTLEVLRAAAAGDLSTWADDEPSLVRASRLLCVYLRAILDRELPTMKFVLGT
jgi:DNA repair protein RecO (recombination protein O)